MQSACQIFSVPALIDTRPHNPNNATSEGSSFAVGCRIFSFTHRSGHIATNKNRLDRGLLVGSIGGCRFRAVETEGSVATADSYRSANADGQ